MRNSRSSSYCGPVPAMSCARVPGLARLAAPDLAGELAPAERAPDHRADALVAAERHQLPLVVAVEQRVVGLMRDVARASRGGPTRRATSSGASRRSSSSRCSGSCPRGRAGRASRASPRPACCSPARGAGSRSMWSVPRRFSAFVDRLDEVLARRAEVVGTVAGREGRLGRDQQPVALALDRLAEDLFGEPGRVDVGAVEHRDAVVEADVDQPRRARSRRSSPRP